MSGILNFFGQFANHPEYVLEIFLIYLLVYLFFQFTEGSRGAGILKGIALVMIFFLVVTMILAERLALNRIAFLLKFFSAASLTAIIVIFQPELRRALVRLGQTPLFGALLKSSAEPIEDELQQRLREASQGPLRYILLHRRSDGSSRRMEVFTGPIQMEGATMIFSIAHDITEKNEIE